MCRSIRLLVSCILVKNILEFEKTFCGRAKQITAGTKTTYSIIRQETVVNSVILLTHVDCCFKNMCRMTVSVFSFYPYGSGTWTWVCEVKHWPSALWLRSCCDIKPVCGSMILWIIPTQMPPLNLFYDQLHNDLFILWRWRCMLLYMLLCCYISKIHIIYTYCFFSK